MPDRLGPVVTPVVSSFVATMAFGTGTEEPPAPMTEREVVRQIIAGFSLYVWPSPRLRCFHRPIRVECSLSPELGQHLSQHSGPDDGSPG